MYIYMRWCEDNQRQHLATDSTSTSRKSQSNWRCFSRRFSWTKVVKLTLRASEGQSVSTAMPSQGDHQVSSFLSCLFPARVDWTSLASSGFSAMTGPSDAIAENVLPACFLVVSNLINLLHILLHISDDHCYFCDPHLVDMEKMSGNGTWLLVS